MKNIPEKIYLYVVDKDIDFNETKGGIASTTRINKNDIVYHRLNRSKFIYMIVSFTGKNIKCFNKKKAAENYIGNSDKYFIEEIEVG